MTSKVLTLPFIIWRVFDNIHVVFSCVTMIAATWQFTSVWTIKKHRLNEYFVVFKLHREALCVSYIAGIIFAYFSIDTQITFHYLFFHLVHDLVHHHCLYLIGFSTTRDDSISYMDFCNLQWNIRQPCNISLWSEVKDYLRNKYKSTT